MKIIEKAIISIKRHGLKKFIILQLSKLSDWLKLLKKKISLVEASFESHSKKVNKIYGEGLDIAFGQISEKLLKAIETEFCRDSCFYDSYKIINSKTTHPVLKVDYYSEEIRKSLTENIICGNIHMYDSKNLTLKALHDELRQMFAAYISSPFIYVNTRIWKNKPNTKKYGPTDWHTDGFSPGHRKIMIYLTPLNNEYGGFEWKDVDGNIHRLTSEKPGKAYLFRNSDIQHKGVAGQTYHRVAIEVTLMRSLVNGEQNWQGHFFGRHFKNLKKIES